MRYRMIAIDFDGTLLNRQGQISEPNRQAMQEAQRQGVLVVPCTGRACFESKSKLQQFGPMPESAVGVFLGGATVNRIGDGHLLDAAAIPDEITCRIAHEIRQLQETPLLIFKDVERWGYDYLVIGTPEQLTPNSRWWFEVTQAKVVYRDRATDEDYRQALRLCLVGAGEPMAATCRQLQEHWSDRMTLQAFPAVRMPGQETEYHVLEMFDWGVDKWRGLQWIAQQHGIDRSQIAVLGDEINDLAMFRHAGCGIAMENAIPQIKAAAHRVTRCCDSHGVAYAIEQMLCGAW